MSKELEERIEKKKRMIDDFVKLSKVLGMSDKATEQRLDAMLEDLSKLMKQRD